MFRALLILVAVCLLIVALAPHVVPALTWLMAFLTLLMLGSLVRSALRRRIR